MSHFHIFYSMNFLKMPLSSLSGDKNALLTQLAPSGTIIGDFYILPLFLQWLLSVKIVKI